MHSSGRLGLRRGREDGPGQDPGVLLALGILGTVGTYTEAQENGFMVISPRDGEILWAGSTAAVIVQPTGGQIVSLLGVWLYKLVGVGKQCLTSFKNNHNALIF